MKYVFVDTNFFIQYRSYHELNWGKLFPEQIQIIIPRQVLRELDNHKNSNNKRRQKRAKSTISLVRQLRSGPIEKTIHGERVTMSLIERLDTSQKKFPFIDFNKPDDCIVNEILHWADANPSCSYCAVSGDIGLLTTCDDCSIACFELPKEWLRKPEPDERDRKIQLLEEQVSLLKDSRPVLSVEFERNVYEIEVKHYIHSAKDLINDAATRVYKAFPRQHIVLDDDIPSSLRGLNSAIVSITRSAQRTHGIQEHTITIEDIEKYNKAYSEWKIKLHSALEESTNAKAVRSMFDMQFQLQNTGNAPAEDVLVEVEMTGGLLLLTKDAAKLPWGYGKVNLPAVPKPPQKTFNTFATLTQSPIFRDRLDYLADMMPKPVKEPDEFYYEPDCPHGPEKTWKFSCVEFRHQLAPEIFNLRVLIPESGLDGELKATVHVYARQLAKPISKTVYIRPVVGEESFDKRLEEIVDNYINWQKEKAE